MNKEGYSMPGKDGTGPFGQGPIVGRGLGRREQRGTIGAGSARYCVCRNAKRRSIIWKEPPVLP